MAEKVADVTQTEINESNSDKEISFDADNYWKDLINRFCYELLKRAVPELYEKTDTSKKHRNLDKEFRDILNTGKREIHKNPHYADVLFEIPLKNGGETCVLFHCESQGPKGGNLPERMNHYRSLIYAHHRREPVALAIITDGHRKEERFYSHTHFGTEVIYRYNNTVLADLDDGELRMSDNPIDLALYAAKCALKAKREIQKYTYLRILLELLAERGWNKEDKRDLLLFLERVIDLRDKELEKQYTEYRDQLSKEGKIVYIPLGERELAKEIEQRGIEIGIEIGIEKNKEEIARELFANGVSFDIIAKSVGLPVERVRALRN